ncbi:Protoheme IX farnesyltransferase [Arenibacter antarcticus]|uniref:UbiA-like protein EboC n=1 Tax=Arenibacter antarcticus TaxID=2040469 RepID=A0ABW5VJ23_9FLAO|nr:UbiA-like protein EboC [Arenibacter sp. H213]MCM4168886.1 ubiquinone biosynthesis protein UbiA [Arenibacter sp. H213]
MNPVIKGYLQLTRPANLPTAAADILAGIAISGFFLTTNLGETLDWSAFIEVVILVCSTVFLYAAGVVLNDVFDYRLDQKERPERPIPSGLVSLKSAAIFGGSLMALGFLAAFWIGLTTGVVALSLGLSILLYDALGKHHAFFGPLNMGLCRGLNLLLGISILGDLTHWEYAIIPIVYIAAITLISRGEVHGDNKKHILLAALLYAIVVTTMTIILLYSDQNILVSLPFVFLFAVLIFRPLLKAYKKNSPHNIKMAVKAGVISIIVLDAVFAVGFSYWWVGAITLLLLPISILLSKLFAVT